MRGARRDRRTLSQASAPVNGHGRTEAEKSANIEVTTRRVAAWSRFS